MGVTKVRGAMGVLSRVTGLSAAGSLALALLAGGCVLAATAGPIQAQATQAQALQREVTRLPSLDSALVVTSSWQDTGAAIDGPLYDVAFQGLSPSDFDQVSGQLHHDFSQPPLGQALQAGSWWDMTSNLYDVARPKRSPAGLPEQVEVVSRSSGAAGLRLVSGTMPGSAPGPDVDKKAGKETFTVPVAVTRPTAVKFGLRPGSELTFTGPEDDSVFPSLETQVNLDVTGIVEPAAPQAAFWQTDQLLSAPLIVQTATGTFLDGAVIAGPGAASVVEQALGRGQLTFQWVLPIDPARLTVQPQDLFRLAEPSSRRRIPG